MLIGPPLIAKTSFNVQPSAMLQRQTDDDRMNTSVTLPPPVYIILMGEEEITESNIFTFKGKGFTSEAEGRGSDLK